MKKVLIRNYWLMMISWCLFLNNKETLAIIIAMMACVYLLLVKSEVNYLSIILIGLLMFVANCSILFISYIPYYFPKLHLLLMVVCFNTAIAYQHLNMYKNKFILPILSLISIGMFILSGLIVILPDYLYTIFSKRNLFIMEAFIFLPYLIPLVCIAIKNAFGYKEDNFFQRQRAIY